MGTRSSRSQDKAISLALRVLEDALARATFAPADRRDADALALGVLVRLGICEQWQAECFWRDLGDPVELAQGLADDRYVRTTMLRGFLGHCYIRARLPEPDPVQRGDWSWRSAVDAAALNGHARPMCNRYQPGDRQRIEDHFSARRLRDVNAGPDTVHPKDPGWVVRRVDGAMVLDQMIWGFPVALTGRSGQKLKPKPVNNARFDKLGGFWKRWATNPEQRCLIPTARYAEAVGEKGRMTETWLSVKGESVFAWAGLWRDSPEWGLCYTGVMTDCAPELDYIHDRCPVILAPEDWDSWLTAPMQDLYRFDRPWPAERTEVEATDVPWVRR